MKKPRLEQIRIDLEVEGYSPGTPAYEFELLRRQVAACQELRGVPACRDCPHSMFCSLYEKLKKAAT